MNVAERSELIGLRDDMREGFRLVRLDLDLARTERAGIGNRVNVLEIAKARAEGAAEAQASIEAQQAVIRKWLVRTLLTAAVAASIGLINVALNLLNCGAVSC